MKTYLLGMGEVISEVQGAFIALSTLRTSSLGLFCILDVSSMYSPGSSASNLSKSLSIPTSECKKPSSSSTITLGATMWKYILIYNKLLSKWT